jgi:hypothetical protein
MMCKVNPNPFPNHGQLTTNQLPACGARPAPGPGHGHLEGVLPPTEERELTAFLHSLPTKWALACRSTFTLQAMFGL